MVWHIFRGMFSNDLAIDLGTANTLIYSRNEGIVCNEPTVVAVSTDEGRGRRRVLAVGNEAKVMLGRTPESIQAIRPMKDGVIADFEAAEQMLRVLIKKAQNKKSFLRPRIIICVPHGVTEVEKRAVRESAESAGAREVYLIEEPMAAAIGAGLPVTEPCGSMVLNIGGGTTEVAVISLKGIVYSRSVRLGGDKFDEALQNYIKRRHNVLIGERTAEQVKIAIGSALPTGEHLQVEVRGRDLVQGFPNSVFITEQECREAFVEPLNQIVEVIKLALEKIPPELSGDIVERGLVLCGGCALLRNLDRLLEQEIGITVHVAEEPLSTVVIGSGTVLNHPELLKDVALQ